ncbi:unnamed protein product [Blepharisma stoltei]|uniref:Uncharacterized protein n=1 Tax=Blepharisma stoltei TaxID=1481888 RepID=A0AAU9JUY1_9CILI|nr:unnamed protein product [Blepharisma stoltei]
MHQELSCESEVYDYDFAITKEAILKYLTKEMSEHIALKKNIVKSFRKLLNELVHDIRKLLNNLNSYSDEIRNCLDPDILIALINKCSHKWLMLRAENNSLRRKR